MSRLGWNRIGRLMCTAVLIGYGVLAYARDTSSGPLDARFRTLQTRLAGNPYAIPVMVMGSSDRIEISFDELAEERSYLRARLVHCNADWQPDGLTDYEMLDGINDIEIDDYALSGATTVHYVNYRITLPDDRLKLKVSGNYLLEVYADGAPDKVLLQARIMVSEQSAGIAADVSGTTDIDYMGGHQQVSIALNGKDVFGLSELTNDMIVQVRQNAGEDRVVKLMRPSRADSRGVVYDHMRDLIFSAGNEYRRFETVSFTSPSMGVEHTVYSHPYYHTQLYPDYPRDSGYEYDETLNGDYRLRVLESDDADTDADYSVVHFSLKVPRLPEGSRVYIEGALTDRRMNAESVMHYDSNDGMYHGALLLKQGAYTYRYVVKDADGNISPAPFEGNYHQTQNIYDIRVYYRPPGARYDRMVGVAVIQAGNHQSK